MNFSLSDDQVVLQDSIRRYCKEQFSSDWRKRSIRGSEDFDRKHWRAFAEMGWLGLLVPEDCGGSGGSIIDATLVLQELSRFIVTQPYLACAVVATHLLKLAEPGERRTELLTAIASGAQIVTLAPATLSGSRRSEEPTAEKASAGGYVLRGSQGFALSGPVADKFIVAARVREGRWSSRDLDLFVVDKDSPGLVRRDYATLCGRGASDLTFEDCRLPAEALLASGEKGRAVISGAFDFAVTAACAEAVGAMDGVVWTTAEYLKVRRAYGTTLNTFQALQHRLADMLVELELSRSIFYRVLSVFFQPDLRLRRNTISSAKALIGRAAKFVAANGIQLHGAMGMVDDYVIGRHFKQLTTIEALFGNSDFHWERRAAKENFMYLVPEANSDQNVASGKTASSDSDARVSGL
jgi:alkylation response protein AidB-like acyl-CoA dehydrogenase